MKKVITYGTFDLLHQGHINILKRAKELGEYLIVGITSENYDKIRGKLNVVRSLSERIDDVKKTGLADKIIIEEYEGQKIEDIQKYNVELFVIGSDWLGKFDYLNDYCQVVYLDRTKGVSSTELRNYRYSIKNIGIIGSGRIANRFVKESKYVSGIEVKGVYNPNLLSAKYFCEHNELAFYTDDLKTLLNSVDAVYIASPHKTHYDYIIESLNYEKHVLCEKPLVLTRQEAENAYKLAEDKKVVLKEAIKTAYCPAFLHLVSIIKSGVIGKIKDIDASFSKIVTTNSRELNHKELGGSMTELASYPLFAIFKFLGTSYKNLQFYSIMNDDDVDIYTKGILCFDTAIATFKVGLGVKTEGNLIISGTKGYAYVPSPWWKTEYFELRFEDFNLNRKYFYKFEEDGLRYEINDFLYEINNNVQHKKLNSSESISIATILERYLKKENLHEINY